jgi:hypothetical protein
MMVARMRLTIVCLTIVASAISSRSVYARERIAVLILPLVEADRALADNLTELAIARVAELSDYELVGTRELRRRLALAGGGADLPVDCFNDAGCAGRVGTMTGVRRLVNGNVRPEGTGFLLTLSLNDLQSGKVERNFFRAVDGGIDDLIRAVEQGVSDLFQRRPADGQLRVDSVPEGATVVFDERYRGATPLWVNPVAPGTHRLRIEMNGRFPWKQDLQIAAGQNLLVAVNRDQLAPRRTWAPYAAYGSAALAVLACGTAALFGTLAQMEPTGRTRRETEQDLETKRTYASVANALFVTGGVLAGTSAITFFTLRKDIFGE